MSLQTILKRNPLYFAALPLSFADGMLTFFGQSATYFQTGKDINEASLAYFVLAVSPWLFLLGSIIWWVGWYRIFLKIPLRFRLFTSLLFLIGHSWGSCSWMVKWFQDQGMWTVEKQGITMMSWLFLVIYLVLMAVWATYCYSFAFQPPRPTPAPASVRK